MDILICTPAAIEKHTSPPPDVIVVIDILRATSTATVLGDRVPDRLSLLVPRPDNLPRLPGSPSDYLVFSELTSEGFERVDNSPSCAEVIDLAGRRPVLVTTNGTIATELACRACENVFLASFLNIAATVRAVREANPKKVVIVPAGKVSNDTRCFEDDQCADAIAALLRNETIDLINMADQCRDAPKVRQRLLDEDGLIVDVDYVLRLDLFELTLRVKKVSAELYEIRAEVEQPV